MKVAIVQELIDTRRGGAESSTLEMARCLARLGVEVTVVCRTPNAADPQPPAESSLGFHYISPAGAARTQRTIHFVSEAARHCRMEDYDIVHAVTPCLAANVYQPRGGTYVETVARSVAMARTPLGRLVKRISRRFNRRQRFLLLLERVLLSTKRQPYVAAVSDYVRRQVESAFTLSAERIRVVFNGVDFDPLPPEQAASQRVALREELEAEHGRPLVLFVAHNFKLKGLAELIQASATPTGRAANWLVAVAGRDKPGRYQRLARRLGVAGRIRFLGTEHPVENLYAAAGVLAHPTWYDPCSRVVLEALCAGLPAVTTRFNGAAEVIEVGQHGAVIESPRDTAALADAIARCFDVEVARACHEAAPRMRERLSMARHARELVVLYEEVVAKS